jgi:hypothetical protein
MELNHVEARINPKMMYIRTIGSDVDPRICLSNHVIPNPDVPPSVKAWRKGIIRPTPKPSETDANRETTMVIPM